MQYFTFLGLGNNGKYDDLQTSFIDDPSYSVSTPFVQEAIVNRHIDDIDEICIFVTPAAESLTWKELSKRFPEWPVKLIKIDNNCSFEAFITHLIENVNEKGHIILDVTHSFRSIPMRLLLALSYAEQMKEIHIDHIYYSQILNTENGRVASIEDIVHDYNLQKVSSYLNEFNDTLTVSPLNWDIFPVKDKVIKQFLKGMESFNDMMELCDFGNSMIAVRNIVEAAKKVESKPKKYQLLIPLVDKLSKKLSPCMKGTFLDKKISLIQLLLAHHRYQAAITFTDELFREEIVAFLSPKYQPGFFPLTLPINEGLRRNEKDNFTYNFSQYLLYSKKNIILNKAGDDRTGSGVLFDRLERQGYLSLNREEALLDYLSLQNNKQVIKLFFQDYRNHLNHGSSISSKEEMLGAIEKMLKVIDGIQYIAI